MSDSQAKHVEVVDLLSQPSIHDLSNVPDCITIDDNVVEIDVQEKIPLVSKLDEISNVNTVIDIDAISPSPKLFERRKRKSTPSILKLGTNLKRKRNDVIDLVNSPPSTMNVNPEIRAKITYFMTQDKKSYMECQCCFVEYEVQEMCQCDDGHLFCATCLKKYAEEEVFGKSKSVLKCMWHDHSSGENCQFGFPQSQLTKALPPKVREKLDEAQFLEDLEKANIPNLIKCPKCNYQAILPETESTFVCPQPECKFRSCRYCQEESHFPLACNEVEKQNETSGRKRVEEAMTNARIRECPDCKKRFYKVEGCNKMTCSCGTKICYICRKKITNGYQHFCQKPHCNHKTCGGCTLYSNAAEDDTRAVREAGLEEMSKVIENDKSDLLKKKISTLIDDVSTGKASRTAGKIPADPYIRRAPMPYLETFPELPPARYVPRGRYVRRR